MEDILARVTLLDAELGTHMGPVPPPSPTSSSMGSPHATGARSQVHAPVEDALCSFICSIQLPESALRSCIA